MADAAEQVSLTRKPPSPADMNRLGEQTDALADDLSDVAGILMAAFTLRERFRALDDVIPLLGEIRDDIDKLIGDLRAARGEEG